MANCSDVLIFNPKQYCVESFFEEALEVHLLGGRHYIQVGTTNTFRHSVAADSAPYSKLFDVIKLITLVVLFPITLIALAFRAYNRENATIVGTLPHNTPASPLAADIGSRLASSSSTVSTPPARQTPPPIHRSFQPVTSATDGGVTPQLGITSPIMMSRLSSAPFSPNLLSPTGAVVSSPAVSEEEFISTAIGGVFSI
ncbi:MAG: hypothetical protein HY860_05525 [Chlamydiales bacterium]|nr:hypothetical protein [Chlamydiales bacterium]